MHKTPRKKQLHEDGLERLAIIDTQAITHNVQTIRKNIGNRTLIAIIKADAYGHGAIPVAKTVLEAGADILGVVHVSEAITLREAGIEAPLIAWLHTPRTPFATAIEHNIQLGSSGWDLEHIARAAQQLNKTAHVHLKIDTGLGRNGCVPEQWETFFAQAKKYQDQGLINVCGIFSHLAVADEPQRLETQQQLTHFSQAVQQAQTIGLNPKYIHLANTPATLGTGEGLYGQELLCNTVRVGIGLYGLSPIEGKTSQELGLEPAMTVQTYISAVKEVPAGQGVSYGLNYRTTKPTTLALIPMGYADGIPRIAQNAPVRIYREGYPAQNHTVVGRIAMDQMVIDLGEAGLSESKHGYLGARVVLFGAGENPPVEAWAEAAQTINYEIVTRISARVPRVYHP
ncbi:alanine racemase [Rothia sp. P7181]|uniref:alanine racemase n=1 Tax=unclassified Rothia (in: high G+C Gram-positive bacteria) TaxID=2689056 RepID=UPI003ABF005E